MANFNVNFRAESGSFSVDFDKKTDVKITRPGTNDYNDLGNKPKINNVTLVGNKTPSDLGFGSISNIEIEKIVNDL